MKERISLTEYAGIINDGIKIGALLNTQGEKFNAMLIGWGTIGTIWNLPVFTVYVRESRYTKHVLDETGEFTVSIPLGNHDPIINRICGSLSGYDIDKVSEAHLELEKPEVNSVSGIRQYPLTIECKLLYKQRQELDDIPEELIEAFYPQSFKGSEQFDMRDPHTAYIGRIVDAYIIK